MNYEFNSEKRTETVCWKYPMQRVIAKALNVIENDQHQRVIANAVKQSDEKRECVIYGDMGMRTDCSVVPPRNDGNYMAFVPIPCNRDI